MSDDNILLCNKCGFQHYPTHPCPPKKAERTTDPVVEAVRDDLHRRSQLGIAKYGTVLADNPGDHKAKLQHAYEEALDFANYLKWAIMELDRRATLDPASRTLANPKLQGRRNGEHRIFMDEAEARAAGFAVPRRNTVPVAAADPKELQNDGDPIKDAAIPICVCAVPEKHPDYSHICKRCGGTGL